MKGLDRASAGLRSDRRLCGIGIDSDVIPAEFGHAQCVGALWAIVRREHSRHAGALHRTQIAICEIWMFGERVPCCGHPSVMVARYRSINSSASPASNAGCVTKVAPW